LSALQRAHSKPRTANHQATNRFTRQIKPSSCGSKAGSLGKSNDFTASAASFISRLEPVGAHHEGSVLAASRQQLPMFGNGKILIAPSLNVSEYIVEGRESELGAKILELQESDPTLEDGILSESFAGH
jgi:hypothetical protein